MFYLRLQLNCDITVRARIVGFSNDPKVPLVLDNGGFVHLHKRLRKFRSVSKEVNPLGYEPDSGHYRNLSEYILDLPAVEPHSAVVKKDDEGASTALPATNLVDTIDSSVASQRSLSSSQHSVSAGSKVVSQDNSVTSLSVTASESSGGSSLACAESLSQESTSARKDNRNSDRKRSRAPSTEKELCFEEGTRSTRKVKNTNTSAVTLAEVSKIEAMKTSSADATQGENIVDEAFSEQKKRVPNSASKKRAKD